MTGPIWRRRRQRRSPSPSQALTGELRRLRIRLTAWYVAVFALILAGFGGGVLLAVTDEVSRELDRSLASAAQEIMRAARIREVESTAPSGHLDALDELRIPGRRLFLFDGRGGLIHPDSAPAWLAAEARLAAARGGVVDERDFTENVTWRFHAQRFVLDGQSYVAVAVGDAPEIDEQYPGLLLRFGLAALLALGAVAIGGWWLARRSVLPVETAFGRMRRFMADAAHELRTPVAVVRARAEVALQRPRESADYVAALEGIAGEGRRLGGIVDDLLTLARADAGEWPLTLERFFLDDVVLDAAASARILAATKGVRVHVDALEEAPVVGDPALLRQLVMILLDNAVKFTPGEGEVRVGITRRSGRVVLGVTDTGPGIPADVLPHVFERFFRGDQSRTRNGGAGLGLSIAQWVATLHGGELTIESPGQGTRATLILRDADRARR